MATFRRARWGWAAVLTLSSLLTPPAPVQAQPAARRPTTASAGVDPARLAAIDEVVERAIAARQLPGAVVVVGRGDTVLYEKAYGQRAVVPVAEPMSLDTIFDLASLTKVVATTTAVMQLVEQGVVRLTDPVAAWVPGFERFGKGGITVRHLLTHVSGLRPDVDLGEPWKGYEAAIDLAVNEVPTAAPGAAFVYSDINFFLLGHIVARASNQPRVRAARHGRHRLPAAARAGRPHRPHRTLPVPRRLAVQGRRGRAAARRGARPDRPADGRRCRPRRPLQHRP
jgi:CubicO group peptidase (beta-lactamase class C family)